jgi:hypothetical protein
MKKMIYFAAIILSFVFTACNEYTITTKINSDGSCERIIRVDSYNGDGKPESLPFYIDGTWKRRVDKSAKDTTQKTLNYSKSFGSVDELNKDLAKGSKIKSEISFDKKFRWFYTYYNYTETVKRNNPFKQLPLKDFLSEREIDSLKHGLIDKALSQKIDDVLVKCIFEELIDSITVAAKKHSLYDEKQMSLLRQKVNAAKPENIEQIKNEILEIYSGKTTRKFTAEIDRILLTINKKMEDYLSPSSSLSFTANVVMPGLILSTTAKNADGNKLTWKISPENYVLTDYKMTSESRVANMWAIVVTGIVVIILIVSLIIPMFRKRQYV